MSTSLAQPLTEELDEEGKYEGRSITQPDTEAAHTNRAGQSTIRICQLGDAGELPEVIKPHRALMKDKGVWVIPRSLQVKSHRESILGVGSRAWDAQF
jgi:hypothetical protein